LKGIESEFTTVDSWDILDNPHGFESKDDIEINKKLYKTSSKACVTAQYGIEAGTK
jgi:hypothetical protein